MRWITVCFCWLIGVSKISTQPATELKSSSRTNNRWSAEQVDLFQMPFQNTAAAGGGCVGSEGQKLDNMHRLLFRLKAPLRTYCRAEAWWVGRNAAGQFKCWTKIGSWRKRALANQVLRGWNEDREPASESKSKRGRYRRILSSECPSEFWFIQTLRSSPDMKLHTLNPRLAVPQPERRSELMTLACYERPFTPLQAALSRGSFSSSNGKHCCGTLTSQRSASWQNGFKSSIPARSLIIQHVYIRVIVMWDVQWEWSSTVKQLRFPSDHCDFQNKLI